ncbi:MAG: DEAD/DEAH box helicase family protein [Clostridium sp.]|nr:MAG: DEAD/DEAH box helicase family protein [Clostridium sp.]
MKKEVYNLREYQKEARNSWVSNGYKGFFVMATGTGKTITALYSIKELLDKKRSFFTVIAVPYIHLVSQWYEDVIKIMPNCQIIKAYSAITTWDSDIINSIYYNKYHEHKKEYYCYHNN